MSQPCARKKARSPIVDLLPGRMTISASAGIGSPGLTKTSLTPGSMPSGSRSSKLAMRARTGTAMIRVDEEPCARSRSTASSAGSHAACGNHGTTPSEGQPVKRVIAVRPCSNNPTSPRNLLTMKPCIRAISSGSRTRCVPARLAITPPRSMSPSITTGTSAAAANPMLAMSPARRLISAGLPAPSTRTISASRAR